MAREKLLSPGLRQAGIKNKAKRQRLKTQLRAGKKGVLKKAGITKRGDRRIIKENLAVADATRAKRRARTQRRATARAGFIGSILPAGTRGSTRAGAEALRRPATRQRKR